MTYPPGGAGATPALTAALPKVSIPLSLERGVDNRVDRPADRRDRFVPPLDQHLGEVRFGLSDRCTPRS